jgi:hypothetical protein
MLLVIIFSTGPRNANGKASVSRLVPGNTTFFCMSNGTFTMYYSYVYATPVWASGPFLAGVMVTVPASRVNAYGYRVIIGGYR